jgi:transposase-like protein
MVVRIAGKRMYLWRAVDHERARSSTCSFSVGAIRTRHSG